MGLFHVNFGKSASLGYKDELFVKVLGADFIRNY